VFEIAVAVWFVIKGVAAGGPTRTVDAAS
jgi:hypothetical protein